MTATFLGLAIGVLLLVTWLGLPLLLRRQVERQQRRIMEELLLAQVRITALTRATLMAMRQDDHEARRAR